MAIHVVNENDVEEKKAVAVIPSGSTFRPAVPDRK